MYRIGQEVECINDETSAGCIWDHETTPPVKGHIYVIRSLGRATDGHSGLRLNGLMLSGSSKSHGKFHDLPFRADRFRPLVVQKTDISIFQKLLNPNNHRHLEGV